jgi:hypothetical protein
MIEEIEKQECGIDLREKLRQNQRLFKSTDHFEGETSGVNMENVQTRKRKSDERLGF